MALLEVENLTVYYGTIRALDNISFKVEEGEIVSLIGPNGAGKSTALNAVAGVVPLKGKNEGEITFDNKNIKNLQPYKLVKEGICLIPQNRRIFDSMTIMENLEMGAFIVKDKEAVNRVIKQVFELFPQLKERKNQRAGTLSGGEQQMLAIARALMLKPKLLLIDEPSSGLSPNFVQVIFEKFKEIRQNGTSILLVEQNVSEALRCSDRAYVFGIGIIEAEGKSAELINNKIVYKIM
jgi:branched-chain amino acid transport system ATP-binding protein